MGCRWFAQHHRSLEFNLYEGQYHQNVSFARENKEIRTFPATLNTAPFAQLKSGQSSIQLTAATAASMALPPACKTAFPASRACLRAFLYNSRCSGVALSPTFVNK